MILDGYHNIIIGKYKVQLYYPQIRIRNGDIMLRVELCMRLCWKKYRAVALVAVFGIGIQYIGRD